MNGRSTMVLNIDSISMTTNWHVRHKDFCEPIDGFLWGRKVFSFVTCSNNGVIINYIHRSSTIDYDLLDQGVGFYVSFIEQRILMRFHDTREFVLRKVDVVVSSWSYSWLLNCEIWQHHFPKVNSIVAYIWNSIDDSFSISFLARASISISFLA